MPTPMADRNTPLERLPSMYRTSSAVELMPTLKSPSVMSTTRLLDFASKFFLACSYASSRPPAPYVQPPAVSESTTRRILRLPASSARVDSSLTFVPSAYVTIDTESSARSWLTSSFSAALAISSPPSFPQPAIDPDTSIRNTRFDGGRFSFTISFAFTPTRSSLCDAFHGQSPSSQSTAIGTSPSGFGYSNLK